MSKPDNRPAIERHIRKALESLANHDIEDALYQIAPAIDVTAKKRHQGIRRVGDRIKAFIFDEQSLIFIFLHKARLRSPQVFESSWLTLKQISRWATSRITVVSSRISYITMFGVRRLMMQKLIIRSSTLIENLELGGRHSQEMAARWSLGFS